MGHGVWIWGFMATGSGHLSALCAAICQSNWLSCIFRALHHTRSDWHVVERESRSFLSAFMTLNYAALPCATWN